MGTRGLVCFIVKGVRHGTYNHFDSYPSGLGQKIVKFLVALKPEEYATMIELLEEIEWVDRDSTPSLPVQHYYSADLGLCDLSYGNRSTEDWYCLLHKTQGPALLPTIKKGVLKHLIESIDFLEDTLFCEWAYCIDFEKQTLETYASGILLHTITFEKLRENPVGYMDWLDLVPDVEEGRDIEWGSEAKTGNDQDAEDDEKESQNDDRETRDKKDEEGSVVVQEENNTKNKAALAGDTVLYDHDTHENCAS
ncbi:hypothetical protein B7494_g4645 [Chlorociboria aeruginascens]|nr:hypothetical protein B7494_g4645 [Chlorociboria aeruginascens]